jgi:hypothetical protein
VSSFDHDTRKLKKIKLRIDSGVGLRYGNNQL